MIRTIFSGNKKNQQPAFASVYAHDDGLPRYDNYSTRAKRAKYDGAGKRAWEWGRRPLYRINVYPKNYLARHILRRESA